MLAFLLQRAPRFGGFLNRLSGIMRCPREGRGIAGPAPLPLFADHRDPPRQRRGGRTEGSESGAGVVKRYPPKRQTAALSSGQPLYFYLIVLVIAVRSDYRLD